MSVQVQTYSIHFTLKDGVPNWAFPKNLSCTERIFVDQGNMAVLVFDIVPLPGNIELNPPAQFSDPLWIPQEGSAVPQFMSVTHSEDGRVMVITDPNLSAATQGQFEFHFVITYDSATFISPDPIIVNRDTGGNWVIRGGCGIQDPIAALQTTAS